MDKLKLVVLLLTKVLSLQTKLNAFKAPTLKPLVQRKANEVIAEMTALGLPVRINEGYRSPQRQDMLYAQGRTTPGAIVTNARGGQSFHNYGVAVDFIFTQYGYGATDAQWETLGKVAESKGFSWGGRWNGFKDKPHCELLMGYTLADFQAGNVDFDKYQ